MVTDTPNTTTPATTEPEEKSFLEQAQEAIGDAIESTVEAVKEHPVAAAAIAAGAAAAVGGAAYAASKLLGGEDGDKK
jgi:hypothetical protein